MEELSKENVHPSRPSLGKTTHIKSDTQDYYRPTAGFHPKDEPVYCGVCQAKMNVEFSSSSGQGLAIGTGNKTSVRPQRTLYDDYRCPHYRDSWHKQVIMLRHEKKKSFSSTIRDILEKEIVQIIGSKEPTVEV